jgi:hypothetical protein
MSEPVGKYRYNTLVERLPRIAIDCDAQGIFRSIMSLIMELSRI